MKVSEIFKSIQGETSYAGLPCVFVRLSGCNLRCSYCDTVYAYFEFKQMSVGDIIEKVAGLGGVLVCLTGGEPLLQRDGLCALIDELLDKKYTVLVETNGSLPVAGLPEEAVKIMDIKCPSSGMSDKMLWENIPLLTPADEVKFVLGSEEDYPWAKKVVLEYGLEKRGNVLFSPVTGKVDPERIARRLLRDGLNVRLQLQLHKILWGDERRR